MFADDKSRLEYLHSLVKLLPDLPGVYQYFDEYDVIIYIGKAKSLIKRVSSYFFGSNLSPKTRVLVSKIQNIKHIVVDSESDAFLLENNLIKKYKPRYNILLKDDKSYPWIKIVKEPFPRVVQTRNFVRDGGLYYGPYTSGYQLKTLLDLIHELYPLRTCNLNLEQDKITKSNYKVCLKYHIKNCSGPCIGAVSADTYADYISQIKNLLRGKLSSVISFYTKQMNEYAQQLQFEKANEIKNRLSKLEVYQSRSAVSNSTSINADVMSCFVDEESTIHYFNYMQVVDGLLLHSYSFEVKPVLDETLQELFSHAIFHVREKFHRVSSEFVVPLLPDFPSDDIEFVVPLAGDKKKLLELSEKNARLFRLEQMKQQAARNADSHEEKLLLSIKNIFGLHSLPRHIECFDNSNTQGKNPVAACVVFRDCRPSKKEYRLFNIKTVEGPDDYASMYEVVYRRYSRLSDENKELPNLIVADGGVGQMNVIREAISALGLDIPIVGLAKDNRHSTRDILFGFPPKIVNVGKSDFIFRFFTRLQDEVHRFAITFHKKKRSQSMLDSELNHISGIGPKTIDALLKHFKSVSNIRVATQDYLASLIGDAKAKILVKYFSVSENVSRETIE